MASILRVYFEDDSWTSLRVPHRQVTAGYVVDHLGARRGSSRVGLLSRSMSQPGTIGSSGNSDSALVDVEEGDITGALFLVSRDSETQFAERQLERHELPAEVMRVVSLANPELRNLRLEFRASEEHEIPDFTGADSDDGAHDDFVHVSVDDDPADTVNNTDHSGDGAADRQHSRLRESLDVAESAPPSLPDARAERTQAKKKKRKVRKRRADLDSLPSAQRAVLVDPLVERCGYLHKLGSRHKAWRERWFILTADRLYYFKSHEHAAWPSASSSSRLRRRRRKTTESESTQRRGFDASKALGIVPLEDGFVRASDVYTYARLGIRSGGRNAFLFELRLPTRVYYLRTRCVQDMRHWIALLSRPCVENSRLDSLACEASLSACEETDQDLQRVEKLSSLSGVLCDVSALRHLLLFLRRQHRHDELLFVLRATRYRDRCLSSLDVEDDMCVPERGTRQHAAWLKEASDIYHLHLAPDAKEEIAVARQVRRVVSTALQEGRVCAALFDHCVALKLEFFRLSVMQEFVQSDLYHRVLLSLPLSDDVLPQVPYVPAHLSPNVMSTGRRRHKTPTLNSPLSVAEDMPPVTLHDHVPASAPRGLPRCLSIDTDDEESRPVPAVRENSVRQRLLLTPRKTRFQKEVQNPTPLLQACTSQVSIPALDSDYALYDRNREKYTVTGGSDGSGFAQLSRSARVVNG
ncbi:MAG: hypothetical protein MHM6MM_004056 [Cercozoa sp. M6MM]